MCSVRGGKAVQKNAICLYRLSTQLGLWRTEMALTLCSKWLHSCISQLVTINASTRGQRHKEIFFTPRGGSGRPVPLCLFIYFNVVAKAGFSLIA